jgi:hypothetical protein
MHSNRTVVHPDYVGFGLGMKVIDLTSEIMKQEGFSVMAKFSSVPVFKSMSRNSRWKLSDVSNNTQASQYDPGGNMKRKSGLRQATRTFSFKYVGE